MEQSQNPTGATLERDPTQRLERPAESQDEAGAFDSPPPLPSAGSQPTAWPHTQSGESLPDGDSFSNLPGYPSPSGTTPSEAAPLKTGRLAPLFMASLLGALLGTGATLVAADRLGGDSKTPITKIVKAPVPGGKGVALDGVAAVAQAVTPSIVHIKTSVRSQFFGAQQTASGSGVIYRSDGYIITNNHVVQGASNVEVTLSTGDTLEGRVVGNAAPVDDIAVIKIERSGLPAATFGSLTNTNVGETAIAIGSPFGLQSTVTAGIVSAIRSIDLGDVAFTEAIQTDAPINPGNSGGALVNARGEVIGVNTAILGGSGGNVGIGFAIPIDIAKRDAEEIIETGRARRPLLGVVPGTIQGTKGAYVEQVTPGTPAAQAGIRAGDVIVRINDRQIDSGPALILAITQFRVGDKVSLALRRDGKEQTVTATLAARTA